jgi:uncharacterized membrane protein
MIVQSTSHWQPSYSPDDRRKAVDAILIIWTEILLYTIYFERLAKLMTDNRVVISRSLEAIIANFDLVVILIMWIAALVRTINDCAIWYSELDRQLVSYISRLVYVPVYRGIG